MRYSTSKLKPYIEISTPFSKRYQHEYMDERGREGEGEHTDGLEGGEVDADTNNISVTSRR
jgi:hypothetical protein